MEARYGRPGGDSSQPGSTIAGWNLGSTRGDPHGRGALSPYGSPLPPLGPSAPTAPASLSKRLVGGRPVTPPTRPRRHASRPEPASHPRAAPRLPERRRAAPTPRHPFPAALPPPSPAAASAPTASRDQRGLAQSPAPSGGFTWVRSSKRFSPIGDPRASGYGGSQPYSCRVRAAQRCTNPGPVCREPHLL